jgi:hypothetical protein
MKHRRQFLQAGLASLALIVPDRSEPPAASGIEAIYERELPPVSLNGWQVTVLELTVPPSTTSPKHAHPGFILSYILEEETAFNWKVNRRKCCRLMMCSMKRRAASICLPAAQHNQANQNPGHWPSLKRERK